MIQDAALGSLGRSLGLLSLLLLFGCTTAPRSEDYPPEIVAAADRVMTQAAQEEPQTTYLVGGAATGVRGELAGLEHRLKTRESTLGKIERLMAEDPELGVDEIVVYDALRYTVVLPDQPPGHHNEGAARLFEEIEAAGHQVDRVKNYWPKGDSYSGINSVIVSPSGMHWELQIHTPTSYAVKRGTHHDYERMRDPDTPLRERQALFEQMAEAWDDVRVPDGILQPMSLHEREAVRSLGPPQQ